MKITEEISITYDIFSIDRYPFSIGVLNAKLVKLNILHKSKQIKSSQGLMEPRPGKKTGKWVLKLSVIK